MGTQGSRIWAALPIVLPMFEAPTADYAGTSNIRPAAKLEAETKEYHPIRSLARVRAQI